MLEPFLTLVAADLAARPADSVHPIPANLVSRLEALAGEAREVDLDAPIEGDVTV